MMLSSNSDQLLASEAEEEIENVRVGLRSKAEGQWQKEPPLRIRVPGQNLWDRLVAAEEEVRRLGALIDHHPDTISRYGRDLRYIFTNATAARVLKIAPESVKGKRMAEVGIPETAWVRIEATLRSVFETGVAETAEFYSPETGLYWEVRATPEFGADGKVETILTTSRNLTERQRYQERLEHLARVLESAHDAIVGLDLDRRVTAWNSAAVDLYGWTAEEAQGMNAGELLMGERMSEEAVETIQQQLFEKGFYSFQAVHRTKDNRQIDVDANIVPMLDDGGQVVGYVFAIRDVTGQRKHEADRRVSEERFRLAARAVNGIVYDLDLQTRKAFRSEGMEQLIGLRPEEAPDDRDWWLERIHPDDRGMIYEAYLAYEQAADESSEHEYRILHEDGRWVMVWDRSYVIRDANGKAQRVLGTITDVTARHRAERGARFLAQLGEDLLMMATPQEIAEYVVTAVAGQLAVDRCILVDVDEETNMVHVLGEHHGNLPAVRGDYPLSDFYRELRQRMSRGQVMVIPNTAVDPATAPLYEAHFGPLGFRTMAAFPRITNGLWRGTLMVATAHPRVWMEDELALIKQAADLTWLALENARLLLRLAEIRQRFEVALRSSGISVYTTDEEGRYTWIYNPTMDRPPEALIGQLDEEIVHPDDFKEIIQFKRSVLSSGRGSRKEVCVKIDGQKHYYDVTVEPLRDSDGQLIGLTVAEMDTTRRHKMEEQVRESAANLAIQRLILQQREEERYQIARDLHDGPIQNAISLVFALQTAIVVSLEPEVEAVLSRLRSEMQKLVVELREVTNELRPPALGHFGLAKAIVAHLDGFKERHPELMVDLMLDEDGGLIAQPVRLALFRIYQAALNNVIRHAHAQQVSVRLSLEGEKIKLEVEDNGHGFQVDDEWVNLASHGHLGLVGMKERAEAVGGKFAVYSQPGEGTLIVVTAPAK